MAVTARLASSPIPWLGALVALYLFWALSSIDKTSLSASIKSVAENVKGSSSKLSLATSTNSSTPKTNESLAEDIDRPLILYAYSDGGKDEQRENLKFFVAHALHDAADFVFILNGETTVTNLIPRKDNIRIVQRDNDCYDMGSYSEVLQRNDLYKKYKRFIFLNSSIRGPMLPYWSQACWSDLFLSRLSNEVKLVGTSANCWPTFHVQSMLLATDIHGLEILLHPSPEIVAVYEANFPDITLFDEPPLVPGMNGCFHSWASAVNAEVSLTPLLRVAGYKADVMISAFHSMENYPDECDPSLMDPLHDKNYYGITVHPFEVVFMKTNRGMDPLVTQRHTEWIEARGLNSYDYCKALPQKSDGVAEMEII